jgi:hypothetical protein
MFYRFSEGQRAWTHSFVGVYAVAYIALEVLLREGGLIAGLPLDFMALVYSLC